MSASRHWEKLIMLFVLWLPHTHWRWIINSKTIFRVHRNCRHPMVFFFPKSNHSRNWKEKRADNQNYGNVTTIVLKGFRVRVDNFQYFRSCHCYCCCYCCFFIVGQRISSFAFTCWLTILNILHTLTTVIEQSSSNTAGTREWYFLATSSF